MENKLINGFNNGGDALDGVGGHPGPIQLMEKEAERKRKLLEKIPEEKKTLRAWLQADEKEKTWEEKFEYWDIIGKYQGEPHPIHEVIDNYFKNKKK